MMEAHRNDAVSALFRDMVRYSRLHHDSIVERARTTVLPTSGLGNIRWRTPPEAGGERPSTTRSTPTTRCGMRARTKCGRWSTTPASAESSTDPEVKRLAAEFAAEETEHVEAIEDWLARTPRPSATCADGSRTGPRRRDATARQFRSAMRACCVRRRHRLRDASLAEAADVLGHRDRVDAAAVLRVAHAEHAGLAAFADQVVTTRDHMLLHEDLVAPLLDVRADRRLSP